jgi:hypothetical protein
LARVVRELLWRHEPAAVLQKLNPLATAEMSRFLSKIAFPSHDGELRY